MRRSLAFLLLVATTAPAFAQSRTQRDYVTRAVQAMAGNWSLDSLRNKVIEFHTASFGLGQEETPLSPARATFSFGRAVTDYFGQRQATTQETRAVSGAITRQRRVTRRELSMVETNGVLQRDPATVPAALERNRSLQLEQVLRAALHHASGTSILPSRALGGETVDGVLVPLGPDTVRVWFDRSTGLPRATETVSDDDILGDRRTLTWYTRWQDAGGVRIPRQVDVEVNGRLLSHTVLTSAAINQSLDEAQFVIPDSVAARPLPAPAAPPALVRLVELGEGVWRAEGGSHHSLVIEQGTGLLVVEAPLSTARGNAVLDTLRARFPTKRITGVVVTHHHHDHTGGLRAYQARGIRVYAHERNRDFARSIATARKTVAPDRLSRGAAVPSITGVRDSLVIGTGESRVVVYEMATAHAEGLLAAWVPSAGVVFTSDVLSPAANQPLARAGSIELVAFARTVGIRPRQFVGGHGTVAEWSALEAAAR